VGRCNRRRAAILLYSHGVSPEVIAEALGLKLSTVKLYIYQHLKCQQQSVAGASKAQRQEPQGQAERRPPVAENQWIALLRSRGQQ